MELFLEISAILAIAVAVSFVVKLLKQPLMIGYMLTGLIVGPNVLNLLHGSDPIDTFAKLGTTILLFIVGLNLSPTVIREVGKPSLIVGTLQILVTSVAGFFISRLLGFSTIAALYVGAALTFSSTINILKLLSDKGDLGKLHAKLSIGLLLVQDIAAAVILLFLGSLTNLSTAPSGAVYTLALVMVKAMVLLGILAVIAKFLVPPMIRFAAKSSEFLFLFALAFGMAVASIFYLLGVSAEIGALIAGILLSSTPFAHEVGSRLRPLRDFFIVLFFISLGSQIVFVDVARIIIPAIVLSAFVIVGNPITVMILMNLFGYSKRTGFLSALCMAQISEFSLILVALGYNLKQIDHSVFSLLTLVGLVSIATSTYFIMHGERIYLRLSRILDIFQLRKKKNATQNTDLKHDIVLFGFHRVGQDFVKAFSELGSPYIVVDFDPESIELLKKREIPHVYGDADDVEFLSELDLRNTKLIVSTIPDHDTNLLLVRYVRKINKHAIVLVISNNVKEAKTLYDADASYVFMPHYLGAQFAASMITQHHLQPERYEKEKEKHLHYLQKRLVA